MAGFDNDIMYANNVDFSGGSPVAGKVTTNGQLLIGSTASPHIQVGNLTSTGGSMTITYSSPNINIEQTGGIRYPISPYVVGPIGLAGYQTIQSAINAANAAGGGTVYIQPGTYTENLTLYTNIGIHGANAASDSDKVIIVGIHTPPSSGVIGANNINFQTATHVFSSNAAGSTTISINNSLFTVTNGFVYNLPNWTGTLKVNDCGADGTNDGFLNNRGGATVFTNNSQLGAGSGQTMVGNGNLRFDLCLFACPVTLTGSYFLNQLNIAFFLGAVSLGGSAFYSVSPGCNFFAPVTIASSATATFSQCFFSSGARAAFTMSSSGAVSISQSLITSSNNPAIAGSGAGTLTLADITYTSNSSVAGTLTVTYLPHLVRYGGSGAITLTGVLTGNGTSAFTASTVTQHGVLVGGASNAVSSTSVGTTGQVLQANTTADPTYSTATYPSTATSTGTILRADGTNWVATTSTYPATNAVSTLLYASSSNVMSALTTANNGVLITSASGVPSWLANGTTGQVLTATTSNPPSWATPAAAVFQVNIQTFTGTGTYTPTSGMAYCIIEVVGAGGGGGGVAFSSTGGSAGGGGAGGYSKGFFSAATIGVSQSVTIGALGSAGASGFHNGGNGGTTSVGSTLIQATGGTGGTAINDTGNVGAGGAGGVGSLGSVNVTGNAGGSGTSPGLGGLGGSSFYGGTAIAAKEANGNAGTSYGAGGGGGATGSTNRAGGAGVAGFVQVTEFIT